MSPNVLQELWVVGVEDGGFTRKRQGYAIQKALFVCVLLRGNRVKAFQAGTITVDGLDATEKLTSTLQRRSFDAVMLAGVSFADFNLVDPTIIYDEFRKPVIVVTRTKPNNVAVKNTLSRHFQDRRIRWEVFERFGSIYEIVSMPAEPSVTVEVVGAELEWTRRVIHVASVCCWVPEPIRVAKLIARGVTRTLQN